MSTKWRVYGKNTVAAKLDRNELPGFFQKSIVAGPNEAALILRDGQILEVLTEGKTIASDMIDQLANFFNVGADVSVYMVDLSPFDVVIFAGRSKTSAIETQQKQSDARTIDSKQRREFDEQLKSASKLTGQSKTSDKESLYDRRVGVLERIGELFHFGWRVAEKEGTKIKARNKGRAKGTSTIASEDAAVIHTTGRREAEYAYASRERDSLTQFEVVALTADKEIIQAECQIRLRIEVDKLADFVALLEGVEALATWDFAELLRSEFFAKAFIPEIAKHTSDQFRKDPSIASRIEGNIKGHLSYSLDTFGMKLDGCSILWGMTDQEVADYEKRRAEREEASLEFQKNRRIAQLTRIQEIQRSKLDNLQVLRKAKLEGSQELQRFDLAGIIERRLMDKDGQLDVKRIEAQIKEVEFEIDLRENKTKLEKQRAEQELRLEIEAREIQQRNIERLNKVDARDKKMWSLVKAKIELASSKHMQEVAKRHQEIDADFRRMESEIEDRFRQRRLKLDESLERMGMIERLVSKGLDTGAATSEVLNTMLQQSTEQEYATSTDEMVKARSEAQAASNNLETYKDAENRERHRQAEMTDLSASMMQAAKQNPPNTIVTGNPSQIPIPNPPIQNPSSGPQSMGASCPSCNSTVQPGWKACPSCGCSLGTNTSAACPSCNSPVQSDWKACPQCGNSITRICKSCGNELQPKWVACPACGTKA
ncbi:zinc ribbon domain-containing protein [bacterium]|nr:zinc ribbon domain-containing protein [bacterium]